jgi:hypothetical protein
MGQRAITGKSEPETTQAMDGRFRGSQSALPISIGELAQFGLRFDTT